MTPNTLVTFVSNLNSHFNPKKFRIFIEVIDGEVLSIKFRALIHLREMVPEQKKELITKIQLWSHGSIYLSFHSDGILDLIVNPLHRGYQALYIKDTINNLIRFFNIPQDI